MGVGVVDVEPEPAHDGEGRTVEHCDERAQQPLADPHRRERGHRQRLGIPKCHGLGQQLAEHNLQRRDEQQHDDDGDRAACASEPLFEERDELGLTVGTGDEARQGDADLAGGDVVVQPHGVLENCQEPRSRFAPLFCGLLDARTPRPDGGELRSDVQRIEAHHDENERQHDHGVHSRVDRTGEAGIPCNRHSRKGRVRAAGPPRSRCCLALSSNNRVLEHSAECAGSSHNGWPRLLLPTLRGTSEPCIGCQHRPDVNSFGRYHRPDGGPVVALTTRLGGTTTWRACSRPSSSRSSTRPTAWRPRSARGCPTVVSPILGNAASARLS